MRYFISRWRLDLILIQKNWWNYTGSGIFMKYNLVKTSSLSVFCVFLWNWLRELRFNLKFIIDSLLSLKIKSNDIFYMCVIIFFVIIWFCKHSILILNVILIRHTLNISEKIKSCFLFLFSKSNVRTENVNKYCHLSYKITYININ